MKLVVKLKIALNTKKIASEINVQDKKLNKKKKKLIKAGFFSFNIKHQIFLVMLLIEYNIR